MTVERERVREITKAAQPLDDPARREYLERVCGHDAKLREEVLALLAADEKSTAMKRPESETGVDDTTAFPRGLIGRDVDGYHIKSLIAAGGMGTVFLAMQSDPRRTVALKVMSEGVASTRTMRRFEYEAQILARLHHPAIAHIYGAGTFDHGLGRVPYFAMEYVPNASPITAYARKKQLDIRDRLEIFVQVCHGVHHGHQKGIIHRDLKPENILVDSSGAPKIIDFGVARATDSDLVVTTLQTDVGQLIGTLPYMSPEQCDADPHDLDIRSDIYSLGVVLYELLCDRLPYDLSQVAVHEMPRIIREDPPTRPSAIDRSLRGDIETITLKALEKERHRRYQSAAELANDVQLFLAEKPITARPPSLTYQVKMFARRHRTLLGAATAVFGVVLAALVVTALLAIRATVLKNRAEEAQAREQSAREEADTRARETEEALQELSYRFYLGNIADAQLALLVRDFDRARAKLDEAPELHRNWEWSHLRSQLDLSVLTLCNEPVPVLALARSSDGRIAAANELGNVVIMDGESGRILADVDVGGGAIGHLAFGPRLLAGADGVKVHLWDEDTLDPVSVLAGHLGDVTAVAFGPDGTWLATASEDGTMRVWATDGTPLCTRSEARSPLVCLAISPDGESIVAATTRVVHSWNGCDGDHRQRAFPSGEDIVSLQWDRESRQLAVGLVHGTIIRTDVSLEGTSIQPSVRLASEVTALTSSEDGHIVAYCARDGTLGLFQAGSNAPPVTLTGHHLPVSDLLFFPETNCIVSSSWDGTVKVWDPSMVTTPACAPPSNALVTCVAVEPTGEHIALGHRSGAITLCAVRTGSQRTLMGGHRSPIESMSFSPDGLRLASLSTDGQCAAWDVATETTFATMPTSSSAYAVACLADGRDVVADRSGPRLATISASHLQRTLSPHTWDARSMAVDHERAVIASGGDDRTVVVHDLASGIDTKIGSHEGPVYALAFSHDGRLLASGGADDVIRLWEVSNQQLVLEFEGHTRLIRCLAFNDDGTRLVSGSEDGTVRVWDTDSGVALLVFTEKLGAVTSLALTSDASLLLASFDTGDLRLWHTKSTAERYAQQRSAARPAESSP